jgi:hypothetical protein
LLAGFLAATVDEYVDSLIDIFSLSDAEQRKIRQSGRSSALARFAEDKFEESFVDAVAGVMEP